MRKKRSIEEIRKSKFCNFSELCILFDVPRISLYRWQKKHEVFPCQLNEAEVKIYPVAACQKIYNLIEKKIKEGFKTDRAVEHVVCSKQYARIIKRDGSG